MTGTDNELTETNGDPTDKGWVSEMVRNYSKSEIALVAFCVFVGLPAFVFWFIPTVFLGSADPSVPVAECVEVDRSDPTSVTLPDREGCAIALSDALLDSWDRNAPDWRYLDAWDATGENRSRQGGITKWRDRQVEWERTGLLGALTEER